MRILINVCRILGLILLTGCGDKQVAPPSSPVAAPKPPANMPSLNSPAETAPPPGTPPSAVATQPTSPAIPTYEGKDEAERLTKALHAYYERSGADAPLVTSLDALVKAGYLKSVPVPPAGKKYVVTTQYPFQVRLENK